MIPSTLTEKPKDSLRRFLYRCKKVGVEDINLVNDISIETITYLKAGEDTRERMRPGQVLEQRWYKSLSGGSPDWEVYNTDLYLGELWGCWSVYSRQYLLALQSAHVLKGQTIIADLEEVRKVVDLGCGCGYTTAGLKEIFPGSKVVGTNLEGTVQTKVAREMGREFGFEVVDGVEKIEKPVDLVFASEYFEHFLEPIDHLRKVVGFLEPKAFLIANSFGKIAIGHFDDYRVNGGRIDGTEMSRRFNVEMNRLGFMKVETTFWNNRPSYWRRG